MRTMKLALVLGALSLSPISAFAQTPPASAQPATPLDTRIAELPSVLSGKHPYAEYFAPSFLAVVSEAQLKGLSDQLIAQYGQPVAIDKASSTDGRSGTVLLRSAGAVQVGQHLAQFAPEGGVHGVHGLGAVEHQVGNVLGFGQREAAQGG